MKHIYLPLILVLMLILEGVALGFLPAVIIEGNTMVIPHWVLIVLVLSSLFYDRDNTWYSVVFATLFGLLIDITYTGVLGVYMFAYGVSVYAVHGLKKYLQTNIYTTLMHTIMAVMIADILIEVILGMVGLADISILNYMMERLLPTILANSIFMFILYPLIKSRLIKWGST